MIIKSLRIHYDPYTDSYEYSLYDREGKLDKKIAYPIKIEGDTEINYFGFCPIETVDVTLLFKKGIDAKRIKRNRD